MATTRIMPLHVGKGRTESRAISDIIDYVANPQKTDNGKLITGYACDSRTADAEFLLAKRQYIAATGRVRGADDVIAYHVRQSFRPGEITPEEANRLGVEFAKRFTKGNHAYDRRMYRYKAHYSLDSDNGIENAVLMKPQTPEILLEEKQLREQLYAAVMALPEKQAKRIYARYYLGMRVGEIAAAEGVDPSRVRDSIRRGLKQLAKYF